MLSKPLVGMGLATLAAVLWALTLGSSLLLPASFPTLQVLWGRYGVQLALLVAVVLPFRGAALVRTSRPKLQILRGAMMLAMPLAFILAVRRMDAADAWAALWVAPLLGMAFAHFALRESGTTVSWGLALVATAGSVLAHGATRVPTLSGAITVGAAAAAFGAFLVFTRMLRNERPTTGLFWTAACVFVPVSLVVPAVWQPLTSRAALGLVAMGTLWLLVLWSFDEALRRAPLGLLVPFLLTEIVWEHLLLGSSWGRRAIVGAIAILACAAWWVGSVWRAAEPASSHSAGVTG